ncbi:MAG: 50S ribosomal protein L4 [Candidatus Omnitrophota bacterium]|nr:50S ribosomal protein L4 [Candidatus Omnitrophota bacterium]MBU1928739.1 50S ribosomal protein L4 [Candidatus Omnitrophota bacterium]MBU2034194.1 50S ribosomal protein L4 [Candidatus Omnitrophota bacterium]MBU2221151.1 50S ribosomal protein L4 [Candidatus Omnitrophota bacterium]MBU2258287.1 50S ribosomal protein L4 [Candidatus Omnitrophota bacterium]
MNITVYNTDGKEVDSLKIDDSIINEGINKAAVHQVVKCYLANQRKGLASTKTRGEVSGGGKKPWKQKGTGRARIGSIRSPLWRHGGVVFGPHPRDFTYTLSNKIKQAALKTVVAEKIRNNCLLLLDNLKIEIPKTKEAVKILGNLKVNHRKEKILVLLAKMDNDLKRSFHNIDSLILDLARNSNTYQILNADKIIITKDSFKELIERVRK